MLYILSFILISLGVFLLFKNQKLSKKVEKLEEKLVEREEVPAMPEIVYKNDYIDNHKKKLEDDEIYDEYLEWCKAKGETAALKEGFDEIRSREYLMYRTLLKHGIKGLKNFRY